MDKLHKQSVRGNPVWCSYFPVLKLQTHSKRLQPWHLHIRPVLPAESYLCSLYCHSVAPSRTFNSRWKGAPCWRRHFLLFVSGFKSLSELCVRCSKYMMVPYIKLFSSSSSIPKHKPRLPISMPQCKPQTGQGKALHSWLNKKLFCIRNRKLFQDA